MFELWYSGTIGRSMRAELGEANGLGFKPLVDQAETEQGQYEDAMIFYSLGIGRHKVALWSAGQGMRWSETGEERWI